MPETQLHLYTEAYIYSRCNNVALSYLTHYISYISSCTKLQKIAMHLWQLASQLYINAPQPLICSEMCFQMNKMSCHNGEVSSVMNLKDFKAVLGYLYKEGYDKMF